MKAYTAVPHDVLVQAFRAAKVAANGERQTEDGGTCNFDSAVWFPGRTRKARIEAAAKESGVEVSISEWFGKRAVFLLETHGQGYRRTRMAEAARDALKTHGLESAVYYQVD